MAGPLRGRDMGGGAPSRAVTPRRRAAVVRKGANGEDGYSGFTMRDPRSGETIATELEGLLRDNGIDRVVVVGLATDYCVKATALDAAGLGFDTEVLTDAVGAVDVEPGDGDRALDEMRDAGVALAAAVARSSAGRSDSRWLAPGSATRSIGPVEPIRWRRPGPDRSSRHRRAHRACLGGRR